MSGNSFRGVSAEQDARFSNKQAAMLKKLKFPKELDAKIDPKRVNWPVMKEWIAKRVTELLGGLEEEVLIGLIYNYLESPVVRTCISQSLTLTLPVFDIALVLCLLFGTFFCPKHYGA